MVRVHHSNSAKQEFVRAVGYEIEDAGGYTLLLITDKEDNVVAILNMRDVTSVEFI